jgi:hypothetical protein
LAEIGFHWEIYVKQAEETCENIGVQFEIKPLERGNESYEMEIEIYSPTQNEYKDGIISLIANDLTGLTKGVTTLIQVIQLAYEMFGTDLASLWIEDWVDAADNTTIE